MFKVGDRVEATKDSDYNLYRKGDKGVVTEEENTLMLPRVEWDTGGWCRPLTRNFKLITEEPMNVITALEKSVEEAKTTLARMEELLAEEQAKAKREDIRVGDFVCIINPIHPENFLCAENKCGVVLPPTWETKAGNMHWINRRGNHSQTPPERLILIHRPTKEAK